MFSEEKVKRLHEIVWFMLFVMVSFYNYFLRYFFYYRIIIPIKRFSGFYLY